MNELKNNYQDINFGELSTNNLEYARVRELVVQATTAKKKVRVTS
jgi:hypothetical protein